MSCKQTLPSFAMKYLLTSLILQLLNLLSNLKKNYTITTVAANFSITQEWQGWKKIEN